MGPLIEANDRLVEALITFENLDKAIDADSDSDDELAHQRHIYTMSANRTNNTADQLTGLSISSAPAQRAPIPPLRPAEEEDEEEEEDDDPFSDRNAVATPAVERGEPQWK